MIKLKEMRDAISVSFLNVTENQNGKLKCIQCQ